MWLLALMWLAPAAAAANAPAKEAGSSCTEAHVRCAYRTGCGTALNNYMMLCSEVLTGRGRRACPEECQYALIALLSTEEGKAMMSCKCEDDECLVTKRRIEVCRPQVMAGAAEATAVASCRLSQMICVSDAACSRALEYYHEYCRSMYRGKKCSYKCRNSIHILKKQEKASGLTNCRCDGSEEYDCERMQNNLARLCFHDHKNHTKKHDKHKKTPVNEVTPSAAHFTIASALVLTLSALCSLAFT